MIPKFTSPQVWQQAELLMQPTFIRIIDNIRKHLETSDWDGSYQNVSIWPDHTTAEDKTRVLQLQRELEEADPDHTQDIQKALEALPTPFPGYELCLSRNETSLTIDLWELCYRVCFANYDHVQLEGEAVEIDTTLFNASHEVDWNTLDEKAKQCVGDVFARLPH